MKSRVRFFFYTYPYVRNYPSQCRGEKAVVKKFIMATLYKKYGLRDDIIKHSRYS